MGKKRDFTKHQQKVFNKRQRTEKENNKVVTIVSVPQISPIITSILSPEKEFIQLDDSSSSTSISEEEDDEFSHLNLLERIIYPMSLQDFMTNIYKKKALVGKISHNNNEMPTRIRRLCKQFLYDLDVYEICEETISDNLFV
jgi:hypothetical protein